jgi:uncharacterized protein (TIGR02246 family)
MTSLTVEQRLQRLEDVEEIRRLLHDYAAALDARDLEAYAELFADDGEWSGRTGHARTRAGILRMMRERLHPNPPAPGPTHRHIVSNAEIDVDGETATSTCTWSLVARDAQDMPELTMLGTYRDTFVREDGRWRFATRANDIDIPDHPPPADPSWAEGVVS